MERSPSSRTTLVVHPMVPPETRHHHAGKRNYLKTLCRVDAEAAAVVPTWPPPHLGVLLLHRLFFFLFFFLIHSGVSFISHRWGGFPAWNHNHDLRERYLSPSAGPLGRILLWAAQRGWRDERAEEGSCSFSRSRASTLPSAGRCSGAPLSLSLSLSLLLSLTLLHPPPVCAFSHSLSLNLPVPLHHSLMPVTFTSSLLPPLPPPRSLVISLTLHALSTIKSRLLPTKTHTHTHAHTHKNPTAADNVWLFLSLLSSPPSSFSHSRRNYKRCSHPADVIYTPLSDMKRNDLTPPTPLDPHCRAHSH